MTPRRIWTAVVPGLLAAWSDAAAQDVPAAAPGGGAGVVYAIVGVSVLVGIIIVVARLQDVRNKRETEALALQSRLSDALLADGALQGMTVTPTVRAPLHRSAPIRVEVSGEVPDEALRAMALRRIQWEAAQARRDFEIEDRLTVRAPTRAA